MDAAALMERENAIAHAFLVFPELSLSRSPLHCWLAIAEDAAITAQNEKRLLRPRRFKVLTICFPNGKQVIGIIFRLAMASGIPMMVTVGREAVTALPKSQTTKDVIRILATPNGMVMAKMHARISEMT